MLFCFPWNLFQITNSLQKLIIWLLVSPIQYAFDVVNKGWNIKQDMDIKVKVYDFV